MPFCGALGCIGTQPLWKCKVFREITPEKRDRIILDEKK
jgi:hypothetical protein